MSVRSCAAYTAIVFGAWTACTDFGSSAAGAGDDAAVPSSSDGGDSGLGALDGTYPALRVSLALPLAAVVWGRPTVVAEFKVEPVGVDAEVVVEGLPPGAPRTLAPVNAATGIAKVLIEAPAGSAPGTYDITFKASSRTTPSSGTLTTKLTVRGAPGEIDETFGVGGRALERPDTLVVYDATLLAGGQLVLAGKDDTGPLLRRFNPDGSRDTSFGDQGIVRGLRDHSSETDFISSTRPQTGFARSSRAILRRTSFASTALGKRRSYGHSRGRILRAR